MHDSLPPSGVGIFDGRIAITGYDSTTGTVAVLLDTDAPEAREWGTIHGTRDCQHDRLAADELRSVVAELP